MMSAASRIAMLSALGLLSACPDEPALRAPSPHPPAAVYPSTSSTAGPTSPRVLASLEHWNGLISTLEAERLDPAGRPIGEARPLSALLPEHRPLAVQIFATYCPPCLAEMPMFDALFAEGYAVVGLSMDAGEDEALRSTLDRQKVRYPILRLTESSMKAAGAALEAGLPTTLIVGPKDRVRDMMVGKAERPQVLDRLARAHRLR